MLTMLTILHDSQLSTLSTHMARGPNEFNCVESECELSVSEGQNDPKLAMLGILYLNQIQKG